MAKQHHNWRVLATGLLAASLCACSASTEPQGLDATRQQIEYSLGLIAEGFQREDAVLASQPVSERFVLGSNAALRYSDAGWSGQGINAFRSFFTSAFQNHQNISQEFTVAALDVNGAVATCTVSTAFSSVRIDKLPPENTNASGEDTMVFQVEKGAWRLVGWELVLPPEPPPAEGGGEEPPPA